MLLICYSNLLLLCCSEKKLGSIDAFILRNTGSVLAPKDTLLNETEKNKHLHFYNVFFRADRQIITWIGTVKNHDEPNFH